MFELPKMYFPFENKKPQEFLCYKANGKLNIVKTFENILKQELYNRRLKAILKGDFKIKIINYKGVK